MMEKIILDMISFARKAGLLLLRNFKKIKNTRKGDIAKQ